MKLYSDDTSYSYAYLGAAYRNNVQPEVTFHRRQELITSQWCQVAYLVAHSGHPYSSVDRSTCMPRWPGFHHWLTIGDRGGHDAGRVVLVADRAVFAGRAHREGILVELGRNDRLGAVLDGAVEARGAREPRVLGSSAPSRAAWACSIWFTGMCRYKYGSC